MRLARVGNTSDASIALFVDELESGPGGPERGHARDRLAGQLAERHAIGVRPGVEGHVRPGPGDDLEGRVRDELGEAVADDQLLAAADLHESEQVGVLRGEVPGEGVLGLVQVVVRVEDGEVEFLHAPVFINDGRLVGAGLAENVVSHFPK